MIHSGILGSCLRSTTRLKKVFASNVCGSSRITRIFLDSSGQCSKRYSSLDSKSIAKYGNEVYYGVFTPKMKAVKVFSLVNSAAVIIALPFFWDWNKTKLAQYWKTGALVFTIGISVALVLPLFLHNMSRQYVTHMFYNFESKQFTLRYYSLFLRPKHVTFSPDDVSVPLRKGFATHAVQNRPFFIAKEYFYNEQMYGRFLGYEYKPEHERK
ncbi:transmembrane protein 70 homolog, mitochondrial-like [Symsagittifera roscoffensis]|uniref:transmembrane protein 70 homolog, mitochondrial-like n=1 Tax=Symsagittifera roscoffensis TaxID=84072 RepID=UPI00307B5F37